MPILVLIIALCLCQFPAKAQDLQTIPANQWELGLALGYGHFDNPLVNKDDSTYYAIPQVAYYGDWGYFDNGDLAFSLYDDGDNQLYLTTGFSDDPLYFGSWGRLGIKPPSREQPCSNRPICPSRQPLYVDHDPSWTWLGGFSYSRYQGDRFLRIRVLHDLLGKHHGLLASIRVGQSFEGFGQWQFSLGMDWKSAKLVDYYYGTDSLFPWLVPDYQGRATLDLVARGQWFYPLGEHWGLLANLNGRRLGKGIGDSPLINKRNLLDSFVGITFSF
ncbi:MipA/OmpV family protein [Gallaecimonas kandeliae]|uniref:MipA/OmpV family protein n=1 Tax=Gallaecimonas kandeliae TaxID=3029055 RepID=UPI002647FBBC|nr:MipA/OmpV family protein [Gallaecimonas kandeliae]WKE65290.1 MipA/OmpV family protein [Gallaecimonas kandeliae]